MDDRRVRAPNQPLCDAIEAAREAAGLSHREFAARSGLTLSSARAKLYGHRPWRLRELPEIARACGVPAWDLMRLANLGDLEETHR